MHEGLDLVELGAVPAKEGVQDLREVVPILSELLSLCNSAPFPAVPEGIEEECLPQEARETQLRPSYGGMLRPAELEIEGVHTY